VQIGIKCLILVVFIIENNMNPNCGVCGTKSNYLLNKDDFDLYKCPNCKLVFVYPIPEAKNLADELYSYESGYMSNRARQDLAKDREQKRVSLVFEEFQKQLPNGTMLDVGSGNGQMMYWAKARGINSKGVELNRRTAERAREYGFEVFNGFLEEAPYEKNYFDYIFLGEIIEHVVDARGFIKVCSQFLKAGGLIGITTPNIDCPWSNTTFLYYKYFKIPWSSVTPPYHLNQFNSHNLDLLMKQEGFDPVLTKYLRIPPLKYELGMLHLIKRYKKSKKLLDLIFAIFSFGLYTVTHFLFKILHHVWSKDFQMVKVYKKL
jgi:2-polyprenyl-3-methyl-5-hydroxy-6-metoxy-1,4-benzoquinol methylase